MMEDLIKGELGGFLQSNMPDLSLRYEVLWIPNK